MASQGLCMTALMNRIVKKYESHENLQAEATAVSLFCLTVKSAERGGKAVPLISPRDLVSRHRRRKSAELRSAQEAAPGQGGLGAAAFQHQHKRLEVLGGELKRASADHLFMVKDARVARRMCTIFQLPEKAFAAWQRHHRRQAAAEAAGGSAARLSPGSPGSPSPSPTKRRGGKRKSPDRIALAASLPRSRFAPTMTASSSAEAAGEDSGGVPPLARRRSMDSEGGEHALAGIAPRQLFFDGGSSDDPTSSSCQAVVSMDMDPPPPAASTSSCGGCPEWQVFRLHAASPSPHKPVPPAPASGTRSGHMASTASMEAPVAPVAPPLPALAQPALAAPTDVECMCRSAESMVAASSKILAGQASPGTLHAAAEAVAQPLSPSRHPQRKQQVPESAVTPPTKLPAPLCLLRPAPATGAAGHKENAASGGSWGVSTAGGPPFSLAALPLSPATVVQQAAADWAQDAVDAATAADIMLSLSPAAAGPPRQQQQRREQQPSSSSGAAEAVRPWLAQPPGTVSVRAADGRCVLMDAEAVDAFARAPQLSSVRSAKGKGAGPLARREAQRQAGVAAAEAALRALDVRGRGRSIMRPLVLAPAVQPRVVYS